MPNLNNKLTPDSNNGDKAQLPSLSSGAGLAGLLLFATVFQNEAKAATSDVPTLGALVEITSGINTGDQDQRSKIDPQLIDPMSNDIQAYIESTTTANAKIRLDDGTYLCGEDRFGQNVFTSATSIDFGGVDDDGNPIFYVYVSGDYSGNNHLLISPIDGDYTNCNEHTIESLPAGIGSTYPNYEFYSGALNYEESNGDDYDVIVDGADNIDSSNSDTAPSICAGTDYLFYHRQNGDQTSAEIWVRDINAPDTDTLLLSGGYGFPRCNGDVLSMSYYTDGVWNLYEADISFPGDEEEDPGDTGGESGGDTGEPEESNPSGEMVLEAGDSITIDNTEISVADDSEAPLIISYDDEEMSVVVNTGSHFTINTYNIPSVRVGINMESEGENPNNLTAYIYDSNTTVEGFGGVTAGMNSENNENGTFLQTNANHSINHNDGYASEYDETGSNNEDDKYFLVTNQNDSPQSNNAEATTDLNVCDQAGNQIYDIDGETATDERNTLSLFVSAGKVEVESNELEKTLPPNAGWYEFLDAYQCSTNENSQEEDVNQDNGSSDSTESNQGGCSTAPSSNSAPLPLSVIMGFMASVLVGRRRK